MTAPGNEQRPGIFGSDAPRLGRLPSKADPRALHFARFATAPRVVPPRSDFWTRRAPFPLRTFGNLEHGCCTIASQAQEALRLERIEQRRTTGITDEEVLRVYYALTEREYGGGDTGAYEADALNNWRREELAFRDYKGRPLTIEAFTRINPYDHEEMKAAIHLSGMVGRTGPHGIKVCLNLPRAFQSIDPPADWDLPVGQPLTGDWMPGSWGGHSMYSRDYDEVGFWLVHTWNRPDQRITYRAASAYLDEAHLVIDSVNAWKARAGSALRRLLDLDGLRAAVNRVSSRKIA